MANGQRILLRPEELTGRNVELFVAEPETQRARGLILFVHGHQERKRIGGRDLAENGMLERFAANFDVIAASLSQPGYGASDGPPDFCGPATQSAIRAGLRHLRSRPDVDYKKTVLYGVSRGATASAVVAANDPDLGAVVLVAGIYDLATTYQATLPGIRRSIEREAGTSARALAERSAIHVAENIRAETLILHGKRDDRVPSTQAETFAAAICRGGAIAKLKLFDCGHNIPVAQRRHFVRPLYDRTFA